MKRLVSQLNSLLHSAEPSEQVIDNILTTLKTKHNLNFELLDFEYFNTERLHRVRLERIHAEETQNYEWAEANLVTEKKCQQLAEIKNNKDITQSQFDLKNNTLVYYYLGRALNDKLVKKWFNGIGNE